MNKPYDFSRATFLPFQLPHRFSIRLAAWLALFSMVIGMVSNYVSLDTMTEFNVVMQNDEALTDPMTIFAAYGNIMPYLILPAILSGLLLLVGEIALHKKVHLGHDDGIFPIRLGPVEGRGFLAMLAVLCFCLIATAIGFILFIVFAMLGVSFAAGGINSASVLFFVICYIVILLPIIWIGIKFAPAAALTVRRKKITVMEGWKATQGRFWWMFLSYLVLTVVFIIFIAVALFTMIFVMKLTGIASDVDFDTVGDVTLWYSSAASILIYAALTYIMNIISFYLYQCWWGVGSYVSELHDGPDVLEEIFV